MMLLCLLVASFAASPNCSTLQLLKELDQYGVRYPPSATRGELEVLLDAYKKNQNSSEQASRILNTGIDETDDTGFYTGSTSDTDAMNRRQHRRKRRQLRLEKHHKHFPHVFVDPSVAIPPSLKSTASSLLDRGYRKVRRVKRDLVDAWMETEDGVRTVPYQYVERYNDVGAVQQAYPRQQRKRSPSRDFCNRRKNRAQPSSRSERSIPKRKRANPAPYPLLPPAGTTSSHPTHYSESVDHSQENREWQRPRQRRIYNPYQDSHGRDLLDDIGSFFVEAADRAVWGSDSSSGDDNKQSKRNWRDQWEERLDTMLGIHNDDEPYRRWADGTGDYDTIISQRQKGRRSSYPQTSLWGGGSVVSLIFSSLEPPYTNADNVDALWESSGSVLIIFRWSVRRLARFFGNICRWATVNRTIPQPAVVTLITSVLLSAARRRWLAAGIALVVTRAIGEAVRESSSGGWDSPNSNDSSASSTSEDVSEAGDD